MTFFTLRTPVVRPALGAATALVAALVLAGCASQGPAHTPLTPWLSPIWDWTRPPRHRPMPRR